MEKDNKLSWDRRKIGVEMMPLVRKMVEYAVRNVGYKINAIWQDQITLSTIESNYAYSWKTLSMNDVIYDLIPNSLGVDYMILRLGDIDNTIDKLYKIYKELTILEEIEEDVPADCLVTHIYGTDIDKISNYD